jgi:WD40 repeat protein
VSRVIFSPDGRRLASASSDGSLKIWSAATGHELLTFETLASGIAFSSDGNRLFSSTSDGTIKIYEATPLPNP